MPPVLKVSVEQMEEVAHETQRVSMQALKDLLGMVGGALEHGDIPLAGVLLHVLETQCNHFDTLLQGMYFARNSEQANNDPDGFIAKMTVDFGEAHARMDELVGPLDARVHAAVADMAEKLGMDMEEGDNNG